MYIPFFPDVEFVFKDETVSSIIFPAKDVLPDPENERFVIDDRLNHCISFIYLDDIEELIFRQ